MKLLKKAGYVLLFVVILLIGGTIFFHELEGWSYVDAFYFSTMTLTTIGYGDLAPTSDFTKIITSFYAILGIGAMLYFLALAAGLFLARQKRYLSGVLGSVERFRKNVKAKQKKIKKSKKHG
jgi:hypothetical protein